MRRNIAASMAGMAAPPFETYEEQQQRQLHVLFRIQMPLPLTASNSLENPACSVADRFIAMILTEELSLKRTIQPDINLYWKKTFGDTAVSS